MIFEAWRTRAIISQDISSAVTGRPSRPAGAHGHGTARRCLATAAPALGPSPPPGALTTISLLENGTLPGRSGDWRWRVHGRPREVPTDARPLARIVRQRRAHLAGQSLGVATQPRGVDGDLVAVVEIQGHPEQFV